MLTAAATNNFHGFQLTKVAEAQFPTQYGLFRVFGFEGRCGDAAEEALALKMGDLGATASAKAPLVRIHSQCLTGEVFGSLRCDCGQQLQLALAMIAEAGAGVVIYEEQEGRGIGLIPKLQAYELQDLGCDTVEANQRLGFKTDYRDFVLPVEILKQLGVGRLRLLSNNPDKLEALQRAGLQVVERVPCEGKPNPHVAPYLKTKKQKLHQLLTCL